MAGRKRAGETVAYALARGNRTRTLVPIRSRRLFGNVPGVQEKSKKAALHEHISSSTSSAFHSRQLFLSSQPHFTTLPIPPDPKFDPNINSSTFIHNISINPNMRTTIFSVVAIAGSALAVADNAANFNRDTAPQAYSAGVVSQISDGECLPQHSAPGALNALSHPQWLVLTPLRPDSSPNRQRSGARLFQCCSRERIDFCRCLARVLGRRHLFRCSRSGLVRSRLVRRSSGSLIRQPCGFLRRSRPSLLRQPRPSSNISLSSTPQQRARRRPSPLQLRPSSRRVVRRTHLGLRPRPGSGRPIFRRTIRRGQRHRLLRSRAASRHGRDPPDHLPIRRRRRPDLDRGCWCQ